MRLDLFLPVLRKPRAGQAPRRRSLLYRVARCVFPQRLFSNPATKQRGLARRFLRTFGPTWLAAPLRRVVQAACFLAFLWLFFFVCWPYSARPARAWKDWMPREINARTGRTIVSREAPVPAELARGAIVHVVDEGAGDRTSGGLGNFVVIAAAAGELTLEPAEARPPDALEHLALAAGPWSLHEADPARWPSHHADNLAAKEWLAAESFLIIDPLVSLSTALAARSWVWSLAAAAVILAVCVLIPRGFCGYICPLGTLIDLFDWAIGRRVTRFRVADDGWWVHLKYYLLMASMVAAWCGVLVTGFVAAIPVLTRGMLFLAAPMQTGFARGWHQVPPLGPGHLVSIALFLAVLALGFLKPRFWCKYVCPSGAVFSVGNLLRLSERKVESSCIKCNKCVEICPFDAIKADFTTRTTDCTLCQTCGGVCPTHAIKFVERGNFVELKLANDPPTHETSIGRRGFVSAAVGLSAATLTGMGGGMLTRRHGADLNNPHAPRPVRPPGSVPERPFLELCIRCGECFKACPNDVLQPLGFEQGLEGLWTPRVNADWAGCESSCNACTQVCPTGAIRALPLEEKKAARIALAVVNTATCLPHAGREACQLCVDECVAAGYHAIEFIRVGTQADAAGNPIEDSGYLAPLVQADKCVGCGLCQTRCYGINVAEKRLLRASAIVIEAGPGKEDRLLTGSYVALRAAEARQREAAQQKGRETSGGSRSYLPDFPDP
jgi:ferredoxin